MLTTYPIKFNNIPIPFPTSWDETPQRIANNFTTEAGTRKVLESRNKRLRINGEWTVTSRWLKKFQQYRDMSSITVQIYDAETSAYKSYTMSITDESFVYSLIKNSHRLNNTEGLYELSFELEEF